MSKEIDELKQENSQLKEELTKANYAKNEALKWYEDMVKENKLLREQLGGR